MKRLAVPPVSLTLVAPLLTSCALFGGGGGGHLDDALDLLPADIGYVVFNDREAAAERLGFADVGLGDDLGDYVEALADDPGGLSGPLTYYLSPDDRAAFSDLDVIWSVSGRTEDARGGSDSEPFEAYKVEDEVDLDELADELVDVGFDEDELRGRRHLVGVPSEVTQGTRIAGHYPRSFHEVIVDDAEHLVLVGSGVEAVLEAMDDDADSLTDAGVFDDVLVDVDDVERAELVRDPGCGIADRAETEEQLAGLEEEYAGLATPETTAYLVFGNDLEQSARLGFDDDDTAEADLSARRTYLEDGVLFATRIPLSEIGSFDLERDGSVVRVALDLDQPQRGFGIAQSRDGFFACAPEG